MGSFITPGRGGESLVTNFSLYACDRLRIIGEKLASSSCVSSAEPRGASTSQFKVTHLVMFLSRSMTQVFYSTSVTLYGNVDIGASLCFGSSMGL